MAKTGYFILTESGAKLIIYVRQPEDPVTDELRQVVIGAYNQAGDGLVKQLKADHRQPS